MKLGMIFGFGMALEMVCLTTGFGLTTSFASAPPNPLEVVKASLYSGKVRCESIRNTKGFSIPRETERVNFHFRPQGGSSGLLDLIVTDWSGRALQVEMTYPGACRLNSNLSVTCSYRSPNARNPLDGADFAFDLRSIREPLYQGPFSGSPLVGYASPFVEGAVRYLNQSAYLTCKAFL